MTQTMRRARRVVGARAAVAVTLATAVVTVLISPGAVAASPEQARIVSSVAVSSRELLIEVSAPAIGMREQFVVLLPRDRSRPRSTVYLLDGAGKSGAVTRSEWVAKGNAREFFADKDVTAVIPIRGAGTFFTDWQRRDPRLGQPRWETLLTRELPPLIDRTYNGTGKRVVMGLSMGAQSALSLLARHPDVYTGAASFSGCPSVNRGPNPAYVYGVVGYAGGDATNMWGPVGGPDWVAHDPSSDVEALRGKNIYLSVGNGVLGPLDRNRVPSPGQSVAQSIAQSVVLEKAANVCTRDFVRALARGSVAYTADITEVGTHSWRYWARALYASWPVMARGL